MAPLAQVGDEASPRFFELVDTGGDQPVGEQAEPGGVSWTTRMPLPEMVALALAAHLKAFPVMKVALPWREPEGRTETAGLVVTTRERTALARTYFNRHVWKPALDAAGVPATRANGMHVLRHTYASVLLEDGVSIKALAEYLGHADPGFTLRTYPT